MRMENEWAICLLVDFHAPTDLLRKLQDVQDTI